MATPKKNVPAANTAAAVAKVRLAPIGARLVTGTAGGKPRNSRTAMFPFQGRPRPKAR
jgi:hypothetical protein